MKDLCVVVVAVNCVRNEERRQAPGLLLPCCLPARYSHCHYRPSVCLSVCPCSQGRNSSTIHFKLGTHDHRTIWQVKFVGQPFKSKGEGTSVLKYVIREAISNSTIQETTDFSPNFWKLCLFDCSVVFECKCAIQETGNASTRIIEEWLCLTVLYFWFQTWHKFSTIQKGVFG